MTGAASTIQWMTESFDLLWRLLYCQDEHHPELVARIPRLGPIIDPNAALSVVQDICAQMEHLHPALKECDVTVSDEIRGEVVTLTALAQAAMDLITYDK